MKEWIDKVFPLLGERVRVRGLIECSVKSFTSVFLIKWPLASPHLAFGHLLPMGEGQQKHYLVFHAIALGV
jgi:hypothetical protein